jgi:YegS/Rv2252/BmrU family lipid kinase
LKIKFIINPEAYRGKAKNKISQIERFVKESDFDYSIDVTQRPKHATDLAKKAANNGFETVVAVGGDGTTHEVVNGIVGSNISLGIIPIGAGNDFSNCLGIPKKDIKRSIEIIRTGKKKKIDLGKLDDEYFMGFAGTGFDTMIVDLSSKQRNLLKLLGSFFYIYGFYNVLIRFKPIPFKIITKDSVIEKKAVIIVVGNSWLAGGGMKLVPDAKLDDGLFDVCIVEETSKFELFKVFPRVFSGTHITHPAVEIFRTDFLRIESDRKMSVQADGEILRSLPVNFELIPKALDVIVP